MIPVQNLKVRSLHHLRIGQVIATAFSTTDDVPVLVGGSTLGSAELDNVDGVMAVRITRLS
jgi:flagellar motor switch protein FliN/FliY